MPFMTTPICDFDWPAADFSLPATDGKSWSLADCRGENGLLVMFICNHCPYVKAALERIVRDCRELAAHGIGSAAIMSNDAVEYPEDSWENMVQVARQYDFPFPYLHDQSQSVARAYDARCTPDFFGFNADLRLQYRGRIDAFGLEQAQPDGERELFLAMCEIARSGKGPHDQMPSMGCSIKWRAA